MANCCKYTAGMLTEAVLFQRETLVADGVGGSTSVWATIAGAPSRGSIKALSGSERWASARVEATASYRIAVRYFSGIAERDRTVVRGVAYNIRFVNNVDFANKWLEIDLSGGVAV
jgi:SPP1 family predicted phage head-tail adaptor